MSKLIISFIFRNFFLFFAWVSWLVLPPENMYKWHRSITGVLQSGCHSTQCQSNGKTAHWSYPFLITTGLLMEGTLLSLCQLSDTDTLSFTFHESVTRVLLSLACCDGWWQWNMHMLCPACKLWCKTVVQCKRSGDVYAVLTVLQWLQSVTCWRCLRVHSLSSCSIPCSLNTAFFWSVQIVLARCWLSVFTVTILLNWCMCFAVVDVILDFVILDGYVEDEEYWLHCRWWSTWLVVILVTLQVMEYLIGCGIGYIAGDGVPDWWWCEKPAVRL